jgi:hypothetical protein
MVVMCCQTYTPAQFVEMERVVLVHLKFDVQYPTATTFLDTFVELGNAGLEVCEGDGYRDKYSDREELVYGGGSQHHDSQPYSARDSQSLWPHSAQEHASHPFTPQNPYINTSKLPKYPIQVVNLARYILETTLLHARFLGILPSILARASLLLAKQMSGDVITNNDSYTLEVMRHLRDCFALPDTVFIKKVLFFSYLYVVWKERVWVCEFTHTRACAISYYFSSTNTKSNGVVDAAKGTKRVDATTTG